MFINSRLLYHVRVRIISHAKALSSLTSRAIYEGNFGNRLFDLDEDAEISNFYLAPFGNWHNTCSDFSPYCTFTSYRNGILGKLEILAL